MSTDTELTAADGHPREVHNPPEHQQPGYGGENGMSNLRHKQGARTSVVVRPFGSFLLDGNRIALSHTGAELQDQANGFVEGATDKHGHKGKTGRVSRQEGGKATRGHTDTVRRNEGLGSPSAGSTIPSSRPARPPPGVSGESGTRPPQATPGCTALSAR